MQNPEEMQQRHQQMQMQQQQRQQQPGMQSLPPQVQGQPQVLFFLLPVLLLTDFALDIMLMTITASECKVFESFQVTGRWLGQYLET